VGAVFEVKREIPAEIYSHSVAQSRAEKNRLSGTEIMSRISRLVALATRLTMAPAVSVAAQEVIDATAMGTSTQLGKNVSVKVIIERWSTKEDQRRSTQAFQKGQQ
jgi:hypothetical protein